MSNLTIISAARNDSGNIVVRGTSATHVTCKLKVNGTVTDTKGADPDLQNGGAWTVTFQNVAAGTSFAVNVQTQDGKGREVSVPFPAD